MDIWEKTWRQVIKTEIINSFCSGNYSAGCVISSLLFIFSPTIVEAAVVESVQVSIAVREGDLSSSVERRIRASIEAIGGQVLTGKDDSLVLLSQDRYNRVLADIVNRVVVGYVVADIQASYGPSTEIAVTLQPVGQLIQTVDTEIEYGNLSAEAEELLRKDLAGAEERMAALLVGLPVDSVGWAESVSQSAGREYLSSVLPEFQASFDVESGEHTKVRVYLLPQGEIVRASMLTFRETTIPRIFMYRAAEKTEELMRGLEGLPVNFVRRHSKDIEARMKEELCSDSFIQRYEIAVQTEFIPGTTAELKVDALTDHWYIHTEAWLDADRDGNKNVAVDGMLGRYIGRNDLLFGQARLYPGPMEWEIYAGWLHRFGREYSLGYKYDIVNDSSHILARKAFGERWALRYERDFRKKENEYGLSYRIHNYMTLEYVYNEEEGKWLRLIANL